MWSPLRVRTAGEINSAAGHASPGTRQSDALIAVFARGRGVYRCSSSEWPINPGSILLPNPQNPGFFMSDPHKPYSYVWCRFGGTFAHVAHERLAVRMQLSRQPVQAHPRWRSFYRIIKSMGRYQMDELGDGFGQREALLSQVLAILLEDEDDGPRQLTAAALTTWIDEHIGEPFDLSALAHAFQRTPSSLCRACQRLMGDSPQRVAAQRKLRVAADLLCHTHQSVRDIAARCGYDDASYFTRVFRKQFDMAPARWRQLHAGA